MGYSSLLPFNRSVVQIHRKQFFLGAIFLILFILLFFTGRSEIQKTQVKSISESGIQFSTKYSLDYEKDLSKLLQVLNTPDLTEYLNSDNQNPISQILSSKIIIDKLFDLLAICDKEGKIIASSRVTKSGELLPYVNILNVNLSGEKWFKDFSSSNDQMTISHLSKNDPIAQIAFDNKNVKVSIVKFKDLQYYLLGYTDEANFNRTISSDMKNSNYILILSSNDKNKRVFNSNSSIEIQSIEKAHENLRSKGFRSISIPIPKVTNAPDNFSHTNEINIFYKAQSYPILFSFFTLILLIIIVPITTLLFYFFTNRSLAKLKVNTDDYLKNGRVNSNLSPQYADRLLVEPENIERLKNLSIDIQEGLKNLPNDKILLNTEIDLLKTISSLNNIEIKDWAITTLENQVPIFKEHNIEVSDTKILNYDYEFDGNKLESLERIMTLLSEVVLKGENSNFFSFIDECKSTKLTFDFIESNNNFIIFYKINNIKLNSEKLENSKISLFINEDDPKYIFNKSILKSEDNQSLNLFKNVVMHIHEMRGVLFIKNGVDGIILEISLPILYSHLLNIDIDDKKTYTLLKCSNAWTSHYDTLYFNNRLKMISTTFDLKNILIDIDDMKEISEIALVRLFHLQNELQNNNGKLVIYKSFGKMESQHFYNLLGVKNRLNIYGDIKMAKSTFSEKKEEENTELKIEKNEIYTIIKLSGKMSTVQAAKEFILKLKATAKIEKHIVIDMTSSTFLNSSVLGVLASESLRFTKMGGKIVMFNPNDYVMESLEVFALDKILPIVHDSKELENIFNNN